MRTKSSRYHVQSHRHPDHYFIFRGEAQGGGGGFAAAKAGNLFAQMVQSASAQLIAADSTPANCARVMRWLDQAVHGVSSELVRATQGGALSSALTTTMQALLRLGDQLIYACVGPSSAFLFRNGQAYRLGPSRTGPPAPSESSCLGTMATPSVHTRLVDIQRGDVFVLCSPGVVPEGDAERVLHVCLHSTTADETAPELIRAARRRGETESASALIVRAPDAPEAAVNVSPPPSASPSERRPASTIAPVAISPVSAAPTLSPHQRVDPARIASPRASAPAATPPIETRPAMSTPRTPPPETKPLRAAPADTKPNGQAPPPSSGYRRRAARTEPDPTPVTDEEVRQLGKLRIFEDFSHEHLLQLAERCDKRIYHQGAIIVREGERTDSLFIITEGKVSVSRGGRRVSRLLTGQPFGEMALLSGRARTVTVEAQSLVRAVELSRAAYDQLAVSSPDLVLRLVEKLAQQVCLRLEAEMAKGEGADPRAGVH